MLTPDAILNQIQRRIRIGWATKDELLQRLSSAGVRINAAGELLFADERFQPAKVSMNFESVQTTVVALGLPDGGTFAQIVEAAAKRGLSLCTLWNSRRI